MSMQNLFPTGFFAFGLVSLIGQDLDELKGLNFNVGFLTVPLRAAWMRASALRSGLAIWDGSSSSESRYHYAWSNYIATTLVPVSFFPIQLIEEKHPNAM
jgi:hypothetical protein